MRELWHRMRYGRPVVVVSGLPRSGTSMAMKMLEAGGLEIVTDGERSADEDNPKGYYEDERVKDLERTDDRSWVASARGRAIKVITRLLRSLPPENRYRVVLMRRDLEEVLASQRKMLARRGEEDQAEDQRMRELLEKDLWQATYWMKRAPNCDWIAVEYRDVLENPQSNARRIAEFLGGALDVQRMAEVVDPELYRNRASN